MKTLVSAMSAIALSLAVTPALAAGACVGAFGPNETSVTFTGTTDTGQPTLTYTYQGVAYEDLLVYAVGDGRFFFWVEESGVALVELDDGYKMRWTNWRMAAETTIECPIGAMLAELAE